MIMNGSLAQRGIVEPSQVPYDPFVAQLRKRGLDIAIRTEAWNGGIEPGAA